MKASRTGQFFAHFRRFRLFKRYSLRTRMAVSYVAVTFGSVFTFMVLVSVTSGALDMYFSNSLPGAFLNILQQQTTVYALSASVQSPAGVLDTRLNFIPGQAYSLIPVALERQDGFVPLRYISAAQLSPARVALAALITPEGRVVASSYPRYFPAGSSIDSFLPAPRESIERALAGESVTGSDHIFGVLQGYAVVPVWDGAHRPIGALYLQAPGPDRATLFAGLRSIVMINLFLLVAVTPVGLFFGWITTRGLVRRVKRLVAATAQFAAGDYSQRVLSNHSDEIGHLEQQFNQMAGQMLENIARRQQLAGQNARLEERSRISRELHDAISQDLFSLRMLADGLQEATNSGSSPADLRPHIAVLEQTTSSMTREMRALLLELRPSQLEHLGLLGALHNLAHMYSTRLGITVTTDLRPVRPGIKGEHALLRIAQEALANAARHSSASVVSLSLDAREGLACLAIVDNGEGFQGANESVHHGLGLHLMRERVEELHGSFELQTTPGAGTRVLVHLPLEEVCAEYGAD